MSTPTSSLGIFPFCNYVKKIFFDELKPVLEACWTPFAQTALSILESERVRARKRFEKMKNFFE